MKVVLVSTSLPNGGKERQIIELMKGLQKNGVDFILVSFSKDNQVVGLESFYDKFKVFDRKKGNFKALINYIRYISKYKPDVIHSWDHLSTLFSILPKLLFRINLIDGSIRGAKQLNIRDRFLFVTKPFTKFIVANSVEGLKSANLIRNDKHIVVYNGIDLERFKGIDRLHQSLEDRIVIGMVANLRPAKDYLTFNIVASTLVKKYKNLIFTSIGDGNLTEQSINILKNLSHDERQRIIYKGNISKIEDYINNFDIGLLLSDPKYGAEGISNSIMEYMALGKPVIATNTGGTPEIVSDKISGFLVAPYDSQAVIDKIIMLINDKEKSTSMGIQGLKIIENKFNLKSMVDNYINLYFSKQ